ncbi:MAG: hypothetical protein QJR09_10690 [Micrococcus sp.]|nr:hypothetical protein [Micrococcus sp.]
MNARTLTAGLVLTLAAIPLAACSGNASAADQAKADCIAQAAADASEATGQPAEAFTDEAAFAEACELYVHTHITVPEDTGEDPDPGAVARDVQCVGSAAEAAYQKDSHGWGSQYSADASYPETFRTAVVASGC